MIDFKMMINIRWDMMMIDYKAMCIHIGYA